MDKIAVISDIHGNLEALKSVLADIEKRKIDKVYCLGDVIGKGRNSNECLNLLKDCIIVYGNWEDFFNHKRITNEASEKRYQLLDKQLSDSNKKRLKTFPLCYEFYMSGRLVRMFHATPDNAWDNVLNIDRIDKLYQQFLPTKYTSKEVADIIVYGHTHTQNLMKLYNRTLINTGSVGNAFDIIRNKEKDGKCENTTNADYLIIEGKINCKEISDIRFEFISLTYDRNKELKENTNDNNPELESYKKEILTGEFRNIKKYENNFSDANYDIENL